MKVVHVCTSINGGAGTAAYRIHKALLDQNVESIFLSLDYPLRTDFKSCIKLSNNLNIYQRIINKASRFISNFCNLKKLKPFEHYSVRLRKLRPFLKCEAASLPFSYHNIILHPSVMEADIIHLHWVAGMLDYPSFFLQNEKPLAWTMHDMNPLMGLFHYENDVIRNSAIASDLDQSVKKIKLEALKNRKSTLIMISPSKWLLNAAQESTMLDGAHCRHIYYPLATDIFYPKTNVDLRNNLGIPENNTVFLFVSQTIENFRKGFDLLKSALNKLNTESITLLIIGYTKHEKIEAENIIYIETIWNDEVMSNYYSLADAFILPSREDNLPNVMLEAIACGTPVLSFDVGGMADVIQDNFNGLKAQRVDADSLLEIMEHFIQHKEHFNKDVIREFAQNRFTNKAIAEKYLDVYAHLLNTNAST